MGNISLQSCDPTGTICVGDNVLSISGPGLGISISAPSCEQSISVGPDATTVTNICPGSISTATIGISTGGASGDFIEDYQMGSAAEINCKIKSAMMGIHTASPPNWTVEEMVRRSTTNNPCMFMGHKITPEYLKALGQKLISSNP